jgi:hypothetical protein
MQFGRIHGVALAVLGAILLSIQAMLYMAPNQVVSGPTESSIPKIEPKTNPVTGILGIVSLVAGVAIFATGRRADEPESKHAVKRGPSSFSLTLHRRARRIQRAAARSDTRVDRS